jgi:hypothetical protein
MTSPELNDSEYFAEVLRDTERESDWEYADSNSYGIDELSSRMAENIGPGAVYELNDSSGLLKLMNGPSQETVLSGEVVQTLDSFSMDPEEGSFAHKLGEAYDTIASNADAAYVTESNPEANPVDVLRIEIPREYDRQELVQSLDQAAEASRSVQDMLDEIDRVVESRL